MLNNRNLAEVKSSLLCYIQLQTKHKKIYIISSNHYLF